MLMSKKDAKLASRQRVKELFFSYTIAISTKILLDDPYCFQLSIEMSCLPPDSKTRLPIHPLLQGDTWKIISK